MKAKSYDLTQGNITKQLISFALPLLIGSLIQQLYSTVDMMFVGKVLGTSAAAAVGSSSMIVNCIVGFFTGLSVGVGVVVGQSLGSRDNERLHCVVHCAAGLTLVMGLGLMILGLIFAPQILRWMSTPAEIMKEATLYIRIYLCSLLSIVSYNIGTGILKAMGDSKTPTLFQLLGGITNVLGNVLFIVVFRWGIAGAALTTLLSQTLAAFLTVRRLMCLPEDYRLSLRCIHLERHICGEILGIGIPSAVQAIMISLSNVIVQTNINRLDVVSIAAFTAYYKIENIIYYPIVAVGQACSAFVSQNIGAAHLDRAKSGTKMSLVLGIGIALVIAFIVCIGSRVAYGLFSSDEAVIALGKTVLLRTFPFYFLYAVLDTMAASIRGSGKAMPTMVITIVNMCLVRIGVLKLLMLFFGTAAAVAFVYPITWGCTAACMLGYYLTGRWVPEYTKAPKLEK